MSINTAPWLCIPEKLVCFHLHESKDPEQFFEIFKFCTTAKVSALSLKLAANILKSFPLEKHNSALEKHVLVLPNNGVQLLKKFSKFNALLFVFECIVMSRYTFWFPSIYAVILL